MADDVPAFDDIPSFDDLPDAAPQPREQMSAVPRFDDIPAFDDLPGDSDGANAAYTRDTGPVPARDAGVAPEGPIARGVRNVAHGIAPAVGGYVGAGAGAEAGAAIGALAGPIGAAAGAIIGGIGGAFLGGAAGGEVGNAAQKAVGYDDDAQLAANIDAHPTEAAIEGAIPAFAGMRFDKGASLVARGVAAGMQGGIDAAQQYVNKGHIDPAQSLAIGAMGAVFPSTNRLGEAVSGYGKKFVPGRPGRTANPDAAAAHDDVGDNSPEVAVGDVSFSESPPAPNGTTVGSAENNKPTNSRGEIATGKADPTYAKTASAADASQVTTGDMDPATQAALRSAQPEPAPAPAPAPPQQRPLGMPPTNFRPPSAEPVVDAGFPKPSEPVAMGANDVAPLPKNFPEATAKAIAASKAKAAPEIKTAPVEPAVEAPPIKGTAAEPTAGQKEAGNYFKGRTHDFGKPIAIETHAGQVRKGTDANGGEWENVSPYHYGYFNKTVGPDKGANGKRDAIDFARPDESDPAFGGKHFIIDQKHSETGKYDEPKVFTYVKDKDAAIDLFNRGFSDNKGPQRLHDITEVSRPDLVKYLARHSKQPPKGPYGEPMPKAAAKPAAERVVVQDLVNKLKAQGKDAEAAKVLQTPDEQLNAAVAGKRLRKYGVKGGYPVEGVTMENGEPVTANTKAKAVERSAAHKAVSDWFEQSKPPSQMDTTKETNGETLDRIKMKGDLLGGWVPSFKPKEWMLAREAKKTLAKPTPGNIAKYREAERLLRGGDEAVKNYRDSNRTEADIAMSKRSGDEAVANAENAQHLPGRNETEDAMIEALDAKRAAQKPSYWDGLVERTFDRAGVLKKDRPKFDVPHEEAESMVKPTPVKTKADLKELPRKHHRRRRQRAGQCRPEEGGRERGRQAQG